MFSPLPVRHIRSAPPSFPSFKMTAIAGFAMIAGLALLPSISNSAVPAGQSAMSNLGATVEELVNLRAAAWEQPSEKYLSLPSRPDRQNALLENAVAALSDGEATESRLRLAALQDDLSDKIVRLQRASAAPAQAATACNMDGIGIIARIGCQFTPTSTVKPVNTTELRATIAQRQQQIAAEKTNLTADLKKIGLDIKPEQLSGLLHLATANDLVGLHAAYANLREINSRLRSATLQAGHTPEAVRRYFGIYTVMLEVAMHMHEETYIKLQQSYLPKLEAINVNTANTYREAKALLADASDAVTRKRLQDNLRSLRNTLKAGILYQQTLDGQARAISASWEELKHQHAVAVNSYRTASLSIELLAHMQSTGTDLVSLMQLEIPSIDGVSQATLSSEFDRLSRLLRQPNI